MASVVFGFSGSKGTQPAPDANQIYVSKSGNDTTGDGSILKPYLTIAKAISVVSSPSPTNLYNISVGPGVFTESNPQTIPAYTEVDGSGDDSTYIEADDPLEDLFFLSQGSGLSKTSLQGVTDASKALLRVLNNAAQSGAQVIKDVRFQNASNGFIGQSTVQNNSMSFQGIRAVNLTGYAFDFQEKINITIFNLLSGICNQLVRASTDCLVNVFGGRSVNVTRGVEYINNAIVALVNYDMSQGTTLPIISNSSTGLFRGTGNIYDESTIDVSDLRTYKSFTNSTQPSEEKYSFTRELSVGLPGLGLESVFGEGDSYVLKRKIYTFDGSSYVDVSDEAVEVGGGSTVTFPNVNANSAIYISTELEDTAGVSLKHLGLKLNITQAAVLGAGDLAFEYFDGVGWTEFNHMLSQANRPYLPKANDKFSETGSFQLRYDPNIESDWTENDVPSSGDNSFWIRIRIVTAITTAPIFDQIKLHTSRTEINADGFIEFFGAARPVKKLPITFGSFIAANASPANQDIYLSDNLGVGRNENEFVDGVTDRTAIAQYLPKEIATAAGIYLTFSFFGESGTPGNSNWTIRWALSKDGDSVYNGTGGAPTTATGERSLNSVVAVPGSFQQQSVSFLLEIPEAIAERLGDPGDVLWISIERAGGSAPDTYGGNIVIIDLAAYYTSWKIGGHVDELQ